MRWTQYETPISGTTETPCATESSWMNVRASLENGCPQSNGGSDSLPGATTSFHGRSEYIALTPSRSCVLAMLGVRRSRTSLLKNGSVRSTGTAAKPSAISRTSIKSQTVEDREVATGRQFMEPGFHAIEARVEECGQLGGSGPEAALANLSGTTHAFGDDRQILSRVTDSGRSPTGYQHHW